MKYTSLIIVIVILIGLLVYNAYLYEQEINSKNERIRELEFENRSMRLDKHTDSVIQYHVGEFRKKLGLPPQ